MGRESHKAKKNNYLRIKTKTRLFHDKVCTHVILALIQIKDIHAWYFIRLSYIYTCITKLYLTVLFKELSTLVTNTASKYNTEGECGYFCDVFCMTWDAYLHESKIEAYLLLNITLYTQKKDTTVVIVWIGNLRNFCGCFVNQHFSGRIYLVPLCLFDKDELDWRSSKWRFFV